MNRRRLARELATLSFEYGVVLTHGSTGVRGVLPEHPLSLVERQEVMEKNMAAFSGGWLPEGVRALQQANRAYAAREALLTVVRSDALEVERSEALVALLRRDLDAHPMFTRVAAAESVEEIRAALAEVEPRKPSAASPVGKAVFRKRHGKAECPERTRSLMDVFA